MLDEHREANRTNWDDRVPAHLASEFYGVEDFIAGSRNLTQAVDFDRAHLGDVRGRSLLHVQCHIGLDTLSWARLGASVTGVDFSERSIEAARDISRRSGVPALRPGRPLAETFDSASDAWARRESSRVPEARSTSATDIASRTRLTSIGPTAW